MVSSRYNIPSGCEWCYDEYEQEGFSHNLEISLQKTTTKDKDQH